MNNWVKALIGVGVVGAVAVTAYAIKKNEKKHIDISEQAVKNDHKDDSFIEKIKRAAVKKVTKILAWVLLHQQQIEAVGTVFGVAGAVISVVNALRDFRNGNKLGEQVDKLVAFQDEVRDAWNSTVKAYDANWDQVFKALPPEDWQWID